MFNFIKRISYRLKPYKMSSEQALETVTLLGKHLRTYSPILAAIGSTNEKVIKQGIVEKFSVQLSQNSEAKEDILKIVRNITGFAELEEFDYNKLRVAFKRSWKNNKMEQVVVACYQMGLYTRQDLINLDWVMQNWRQKQSNDG